MFNVQSSMVQSLVTKVRLFFDLAITNKSMVVPIYLKNCPKLYIPQKREDNIGEQARFK